MAQQSTSRPFRNRVTPFGEIVATPQRGSLMGNRGCLHDDQHHIVTKAKTPHWISCQPTWPGVHRQLMAPGRYTELFFHDEATALAAGHRPCGDCRRDRLDAFKAAWRIAKGMRYPPRVTEIDATLRAEQGASRNLVTIADPAELPGGAMFTTAARKTAWLRWQASNWSWSFDGYSRDMSLDEGPYVALTVPSVLQVLHAGYMATVIGIASVCQLLPDS